MDSCRQTDNAACRKKKDAAAFHCLYRVYAPCLYGVILRLISDPIAADALLKESFIEIWQRIDSRQPHEVVLFNWMIGIVLKKCSHRLHLTLREVLQQVNLINGNIQAKTALL